jgi:peptidoglycan/xylan/chitin deacetylase (PgdA/CDA1 family)
MKIVWKDIVSFIFGVVVISAVVSIIFTGCVSITQNNTNNEQNIISNTEQIQQRNLAIGTQGADVWDLHQQLHKLISNEITKELAMDDKFNETTQFYVILFQLSQNLEPTGVVDIITKEALLNNPIMPSEQDLMELKLLIPIDENEKNIIESEIKYKDKIAYLTFDDGPNPTYTPQIIDILKKYNAGATFFVLGQEVDKFPNIIKNTNDKKRVFANHTYSYNNIETVSDKIIKDEILKTNKAIKNVTNKTPICFRPPYSAINSDIKQKISDASGKIIMWDVDTQDWAKPGIEEIVQHVLNYTQNGEIILMHDGGGDRTQTVTALDKILNKMTSDGWEFRALDCVR